RAHVQISESNNQRSKKANHRPPRTAVTRPSWVLVRTFAPPGPVSIYHAPLVPNATVVDDQKAPPPATYRGLPVGNAGPALLKSNTLANSLMLGSRQSPATLPSERPHATLPLANVFAAVSALAQV